MSYEIFAVGSNYEWKYRLLNPDGTASATSGKLSGDPETLVLFALCHAAASIAKRSTVNITVPLYRLVDNARDFTTPTQVSPLAFKQMSADRRAQWSELLRHLDGITTIWHAASDQDIAFHAWKCAA